MRIGVGTVECRDTVTVATQTDVRRVALASAIGTTIEWYDFFIYGTAAAVVFGPQFFPQISEVAGRLAAFATFAVGFIARPLGGIVMGHFGDRLGRKSMLVWSLMLMGIATLRHRPAAELRAHRHLGAGAARCLPLPAGLRARRRVGRRGPDVGGARTGGAARCLSAVSSHSAFRPASSCRTSCS